MLCPMPHPRPALGCQAREQRVPHLQPTVTTHVSLVPSADPGRSPQPGPPAPSRHNSLGPRPALQPTQVTKLFMFHVLCSCLPPTCLPSPCPGPLAPRPSRRGERLRPCSQEGFGQSLASQNHPWIVERPPHPRTQPGVPSKRGLKLFNVTSA